MKVYDNILTDNVFNQLKEKILDGNIPWYFFRTSLVNPVDDNVLTYSFTHMVSVEGVANSPLYDTVYLCILSMLDKCEIKPTKINRIRIGLLHAQNYNHRNDPHVDFPAPHSVGLFYLNTSNGPTTIYKEKYDPFSKVDPVEYYANNLNKNLTVDKEVGCIENRLVIFDGMTYHSSTHPTDVPRRIAINFNFEV